MIDTSICSRIIYVKEIFDYVKHRTFNANLLRTPTD